MAFGFVKDWRFKGNLRPHCSQVYKLRPGVLVIG